MSQDIFESINPSTTSGNQLATILNGFKDALVSGLCGTSRPSALQAGGYWIDITDDATGIWRYKLYDGTSDITIFTINKNTGKVTIQGSEGAFEISVGSDDAIGPRLSMMKQRTSGSKQTVTNDSLGKTTYTGMNNATVTELQAEVEVITIEDTSPTQKGSQWSVSTIAQGAAALVKRLIIKGDKVGVGVDAPTKTLEVDSESRISKTSEDAVAPVISIAKSRVNINGQTIDADGIGVQKFFGKDETGAEVEVARIEVIADGVTSTTNAGSILSIQTVKSGEVALSEAIRIEDGVVTLAGVSQSLDTKSKVALSSGVDNALTTIDSDDYGAVDIELFIDGYDSVIGAVCQTVRLKGVYCSGDTSWQWSEEGEILVGDERAIELNITDVAEVLTVKYDNQLTNFVSGFIYIQIRRHEV